MSTSLSEIKLHMNLDAFGWLPLEDWNTERLIAYGRVNGKRSCKVCDEWLTASEEEKHIASHVKYEQDRRNRRKEENEAARQEALRIAREEKRKSNENYKAVLGKPKTEKVKRSVKSVKSTSSSEPMVMPEGEFTVNEAVEATGRSRPEVYKEITRLCAAGELIQVGTVKSGGRGRPAVIYGRN